MRFCASSSRRCWAVSSQIAILLLLTATNLSAAKWTFTPFVSTILSHTDNLELEPDSAKTYDVISQVNPGFTLRSDGARADLNFDYTMQNLLYKNNSRFNSEHHQLNLSNNIELVRNHLYLNSSITRSQFSLEPEDVLGISSTTDVDRKDATNYYISPTYKQDFNGYSVAAMKFSESRVNIHDDPVADSNIQDFTATVSSGKKFTQLDWNISYGHHQIKRDNENDLSSKSSRAEFAYSLVDQLRLLGVFGYEDNDIIDSNSVNEKNGSYRAFGLGWQPSSKFNSEFNYGENYKSAMINVVPTARTNFTLRWQDSSVGTILGESWNADFSLALRSFSAAATYSEQIKTQSDYLGELFGASSSALSLSSIEEPVKSKRGEISLSKNTAITEMNLSFRNEKIENLVSTLSLSDTTIRSGRATVRWRAAALSHVVLEAINGQILPAEANKEIHYKTYIIRFEREARRFFTSSVALKRSSKNSQELADSSYSANRIDITLKYTF